MDSGFPVVELVETNDVIGFDKLNHRDKHYFCGP